MADITITVSRELAATIYDALNDRRIRASASRHPHIVAHREVAEARAVQAQAEYDAYVAAIEIALEESR